MTGGTNGNGGVAATTGAGSGGGFFTDGSGGTATANGNSYISGGLGGVTQGTYSVNGGGFGGGGSVTSGGNSRYAGGGGYSGGSGSNNQSGASTGLWGGGGGSYNNGTNQVNQTGVREGHGLVRFSPANPVCESALFPVEVIVDAPAAPTAIANPTNIACAGTSELVASGGGGSNYAWYDDPSGNNLVHVGSNYTTPVLTNTQTFYVSSINTNFSDTLVFTNCGAEGREGPTQPMINAEYAGTPLDGEVTSNNGIQIWTVPVTGNYIVEAYGAQGSTATATTGGKGAFVAGEFSLTAGEELQILVGQNAPNTPGRENLSSSGGGGSFVTMAPHNTNASILVIAGGGGGTGDEQPATADGTSDENGQTGSHGSGGINGNGGTTANTSAGAGGGFFTDGDGGTAGGEAYVNGGLGGVTQGTYSVNGGGFGGGGSVTSGGNSRYAGGGGYSGGSGSNNQSGASTGLWGGGGGSYNNGTNQVNQTGVNEGHGMVRIYAATPPCESSLTPVTVTVDAAPTPPNSADLVGSFCFGGQATLAVNGGTLPFGSQWEWYDDFCGGNLVAVGDTVSVTPTTTTTYYVRASAAGSCPILPCEQITVNPPIPSNELAEDGATATCVLNQSGFVHFLDANGDLVVSIDPNGQNLGEVIATAYVAAAPVLVPDCNDPTFVTSVMDRHWVITPEFQPTGPVTVKLPVDDTELNSLITASNQNTNSFDNVSNIGDVFLSKYSGPNNVDNDFANNCPSAGGDGGTTIHVQSANGSLDTVLANHPATHLFIDFVINDFSEFWLHGGTPSSALPVEMSYFNSTCKNDSIYVSWGTESEINSSHFIIESSTDGMAWTTVDTIMAQGSSNSLVNYLSIRPVRNNLSYYRLVQVDFNGDSEVYGPISANCYGTDKLFKIYPNPTNEVLFLDLLRGYDLSEHVSVSILDATGKVVLNRTLTSNDEYVTPLNVSSFENGVYIIQVCAQSETCDAKKFVIHR